ncbi:FAD/NAD(P)-binding protein [Streptomyces sp. NPDC088387]|uniref:FAD/NAD(P)-binding protein n=1 Tax=Streptomyces sp. NPDC088387 TaxID=3365859 RepID=UPI00382CA74E
MRRVAVVGAGAAGSLTAVQLLRQGDRLGIRVQVWLIDPSPRTGPGVAYGTTDPRHLLNVPAGRMSAFPDEPAHFLDWLRTRQPTVGPGDFVPRAVYGRYLGEVVARAAGTGPGARIHRVHDRVTAARPRSTGWVLELADGGAVEADAAVLALGSPAPALDWAGPELAGSGRLVADPWAPGALDTVGGEGDVLLVGTGLTMVDAAIALGRPGRVVHALSRSGLIPAAHLPQPAQPVAAPDLDAGCGLDALRRQVRRHLAASRRECGDWRPGMDGLRPVTARWWGQLPVADRARFLAEDLRLWEVHRHRIAPATAAAFHALREAGLLRTGTGQVTRAAPDGDAVLVDVDGGRTLRVAAVVNCTGTPADLRRSTDPLVRRLLDEGYARCGPAGLGLDTDDDGRLQPAAGGAGGLWTIGAARRGNLLETTALPEIRAQAAAVATALLTTPVRRGGRPVDRYGLALSTTREAARLYDGALERILAGRTCAQELLEQAVRADPGFALGHAALALLAGDMGDHDRAGAALAAARRAAPRSDARERGWVGVVHTRLTGSEAAGRTGLLEHVGAHPRDALAVGVAVPTVSFNGITGTDESCALVERLAPFYGDDWWYLGQLAFVRQEQGRWQEAEELAVRALHGYPAAGHAVHARAHVLYETGEHRAGLAWLERWLDEHGDTSGQRAHLSWHAALHELTLDDLPALLARYHRELTASRVSGGRLLVDSVSLLWRARMTGSWSGELPVAELLAAAPDEWLHTPPTPFAALHGALAHAAAGDVAALARLHRWAVAGGQELLVGVIAPLCEALTAVLEQRWQQAAVRLEPLRAVVGRVGASRAQQEVVEETLLYALVAGGARERAGRLLAARLERRASPLDRRRLAALDGARRAGRRPVAVLSAAGAPLQRDSTDYQLPLEMSRSRWR